MRPRPLHLALGLLALGCSSRKPAFPTYSFTTADGSVAEVRFNGTPIGRTPLTLTIEDLRPHLRAPEGEGSVKITNKGSGDFAYVTSNFGEQGAETLRTLGEGTFRLGLWSRSEAGPVSGELDLRVVSVEDGEPLELAIEVPSSADITSTVESAVRIAQETTRKWKFQRHAAPR